MNVRRFGWVYKSVDGRTKNKILGCIFSEKLYLEEKKVATPKFTTPIELLLNASKVLQNCRNKKEVNNDLFVQLAPPIGESCSFTSMIDYSIILKSNIQISNSKFHTRNQRCLKKTKYLTCSNILSGYPINL
jgi:hypothetical protein